MVWLALGRITVWVTVECLAWCRYESSSVDGGLVLILLSVG